MGRCQRIRVEGRSQQQEFRVSEFQRDDSVMTVLRNAGDSRSLPGVFFRCRASGKHWIKDA